MLENLFPLAYPTITRKYIELSIEPALLILMASKTNLLTIMTLFKEKISVLFCLDGFELQRIYSDFICVDEEGSRGHGHVIFKDSLISTYDEITRRFHARTLICGTPSIISTTGIIEAPAKPRDYYFKMMLSDLLNLSNEEIKTKFNGRFIDYGDPSVFCARLRICSSGGLLFSYRW